MKIFYTRKEYKMLQDENIAIKESRNNYRNDLNKEYEKEAVYIKKYNELLAENQKLKDKCAAYSKYYFEESKLSEEIQEKVARDLEVVRLKDELYKERVLNKLTFISATNLCNLNSRNCLYTRIYY